MASTEFCSIKSIAVNYAPEGEIRKGPQKLCARAIMAIVQHSQCRRQKKAPIAPCGNFFSPRQIKRGRRVGKAERGEGGEERGERKKDLTTEYAEQAEKGKNRKKERKRF